MEGVSGGFATRSVPGACPVGGRRAPGRMDSTPCSHDGSRFYPTTPTDSQVSNGEALSWYPMDTASSGTPDVDPSLTAARCLNIWEVVAESPKATARFDEVRGSGNDLKFYATVSNNGLDSVCRYHLEKSTA